MNRLPKRAAQFSVAVLVLALSHATGQSLYGFDGAGSIVLETTGPPGGPCGYPNGPLLSAFPTPVTFVCPLPVAAGPPPQIDGDIAVNKITDTVWVTDGLVCGEYVGSGAALGTPLTGFVPLPFGTGAPVTGLGFDSVLGLLWMTEGTFAQALIPPPPPGCPAVGFVAIPPFPLPLPPGALATDIDWDPVTGTLWVCDITGMVTNVMVGGAIGPFGTFPAAPGPCGLMPLLQGLAIDTVGSTVFGLPCMYVTDGFMVAYEVAGGWAGPPTFYTPAPCYPTMGPLLGLAFAARALPYGTGADTSGIWPPNIGSIGQTISPNLGFTVTLSGSVAGSTAFLFMGTTGFYCPPPVITGLPIYIDLTLPPALLGTAIVGAGGGASLTPGIPPGLPPGIGAWLQWYVVTPNPSRQVTEGLAILTDLP